jgi:spermidine synthase
MSPRAFFGLFLISGFCGLVYQVVWLRVAMAQFGVTTPLVSIVLSVFMAGLALGSWAGGALGRRFAGRSALLLRLYAGAELAIALSASAVPQVLALGRDTLVGSRGASEWASGSYYAASGTFVALALLPFCACMGATLPLAMGVIRQAVPLDAERSFSYLYLANLLGAALGTLLSAFVLIELLGFRGTLQLAAGLNALLAASALGLSLRLPTAAPTPVALQTGGTQPSRLWLLGLFTTGLVSMAMEVVWVRLFTAYLGNMVYAFAIILTVYLVASFFGSGVYRTRHAAPRPPAAPWAWLGFAGLLPLVATDPRLPLVIDPLAFVSGALRVTLGVALFSSLAGFLTPLLVDRFAQGDPHRAGRAYAVNVAGCVIGPLLAGFILIPRLGERATLIVLGVVLFAFPFLGKATRRAALPATAGALLLSAALLATARSYESRFEAFEIRRDNTATVLATGEGRAKRLLVNGVGMTALTPVTKLMAHLPLAMLEHRPQAGLVICLGMGTSYRSVLSWGIKATAVELVPSVPELLPFFHADGAAILASPQGHIVVDDGRRYLERSGERFDVIVVDPPPPVSAAGSSLLYSREFYAAVRPALAPGGIIQAWIPDGDEVTMAAFVRAILESFPHVRAFGSVEGWGLHLLASDAPLAASSSESLASRLPEGAAQDLVEWGPAATPEEQFAKILAREVDPGSFVRRAPGVAALRDDHPVNEYFVVRACLRR